MAKAGFVSDEAPRIRYLGGSVHRDRLQSRGCNSFRDSVVKPLGARREPASLLAFAE